MAGISGININIYWRLITCWSQSFVLCGKATKLREATLQIQINTSFIHFPPNPSHQLSPHPSVHPRAHHTQSSHQALFSFIQCLPWRRCPLCPSFHTCVWLFSLPLSPCTLSHQKHPTSRLLTPQEQRLETIIIWMLTFSLIPSLYLPLLI